MKEFRISNGLIVEGDGTYDQTVLNVTGSQGQLFSVTDRLDGDIFSVSGISGVPILNVNSNGDVTISTLQTSTSESVVVETGGVLAKRDMTDITTAGLWVEGTGLIYPKDIGNHVGIGLVAPTSVLDIKADTGTANTFQIRHSSGDIGLSVNQSTNWADSTSGVIFKMFDGASSTQTIHLDSRSSATYKSYFNAGNFGFGIADPQFLVHLHAESTPYLHFTNNGSGTTSTDGMSIGLSGASGLVWVRDNYYLRFGTNALERMRINANGYISMGIGAASASYPLVVNIPAGNRARFDYTTTGVYMDFVDYTTGTFAYSNTIGIFGAGKNFLHMSSSGKSQKFVVHNGTTYLPGMTLSKDAKLTVHGDLDVQDDAVISGFTNATLFSTENTAYRTYNPKGGLSMLATTAVTGAIVIKLPPYAGNSYTSFWVDVFNYTGGNSFSLYFGAYYYKSGTVAFYPRGNGILATEDWHDYQIQYYIDDVEEQAIIVIGTVTSEWYSPMVTVRDVSQRLYNYLREGWEISLSTDLSAYRLQTTIPNSFIYSDYNRMINAPTIPSEANDATITLTAGNGLITGGAFTTNQAANETITFTLGTPGTLTNSSTNSASASSHTHAITNYALTSTTTNQLTITGASRVLGVAGSLAIKTATVANAGTALATGDQIYDFVIGLGYSTTVGTVTSVGTSGAILGGTFTDSGTISHSDATGYKHIPTAGAATQILRWSASGTAVWYTPPWTENTGTITSVSSGAGMNFTNVSSGGVTITMGTPGTLTSSTSNSASGTTHTHAVTFPAPPDVYWERVNSKWLRPKTTTDFVYLQATGRNDTTSQHITRQLGSISFSQQYAYRELRIATGTTSTTVLNGVFKIRVTSDSGSVATTSYLEKIIYIATYYSGTDSTVYAQDSYYTSKLRSYHSRITDFYVDGANNEIVLQIWSTYNGSRSFNIEIDYVGKNAHNFLNATLGSQINGVIGDLPVTEYQGTSPNSEFKIAKTLTTAGDFLTISADDLVGQRTTAQVITDLDLDNKYLKLNTSNDPLTGTLDITRTSGYASIEGTDWLIMDSGDNAVALNYYSNDDVLLAYGGGNVGIGTTTPIASLHIQPTKITVPLASLIDGGIIVTNNSGSVAAPTIASKGTSSNSALQIIVGNQDDIKAADLIFSTRKDTNADFTEELNTGGFSFRRYSTTLMQILRSGAVGIGTATPSYKLDVAGDVRITVIDPGTSDYDKFLVSDAGEIKYRTGDEVVSDLGIADMLYNVSAIGVPVYRLPLETTRLTHPAITFGETDPWTWFAKIKANLDDETILSIRGNYGAVNTIRIRQGEANILTFRNATGTTTMLNNTDTSAVMNNIGSVALTFDGVYLKGYVNGVLQETIDISGVSGVGGILFTTIGEAYANNAANLTFKGDYYADHLYDVALTEEQLAQLSNNPDHVPYGLTPVLKLGGGKTASTWFDESGNGRDASTGSAVLYSEPYKSADAYFITDTVPTYDTGTAVSTDVLFQDPTTGQVKSVDVVIGGGAGESKWTQVSGRLHPKIVTDRVSIGHTNSTAVLDIQAEVGTANVFQTRHSTGKVSVSINQSSLWDSSTIGGAIFKIFNGLNEERIHLDSRTNTNSYINAGNLGIGNNAPAYQLDVAGTFRVTETTLLQGNVTAQAKVDITGITTFNSVKVDYVSTILRRMSNIANHAFGSTIPVGTMVIYPNLASTAAMLKFKISGKSYDNSWDLTFSSYLSTSNWVRPSEVTVVGDAPFTADQVRLSFDSVTGNHYILLGSTTTSWTNYMTVFIDVEESWGATRTSLTGWTIEVTTTEPAATSTVTPSVSFFGGKTTIRTNLTLKNLVKGTADYDQFLVSDSGLVKYRTGAEVLSDIGASATTHTHTLQEVTNAGNTTTNDIESTAQVKATGGFVARDSANADAATMAYNDTTETLDFTFA